MSTWIKPVRELNGQEQSQVESYRRMNKTPLEICRLLEWDEDRYLGVVMRHCETMPRRYRVGVMERLSAAMSVDRSGTKPKWGTV